MQDIKVLYTSTAIAPFLQLAPMSTDVQVLLQDLHKDKEIRVFSPLFGVINQLKNRIHSIYRLSGINIPVGKEDISLVVKVASIKEFKTQVYFTDNEDLFQRKGIFHDKDNTLYKDNDIRSLFFCKSVLATIKELNWSPDIIHCHGWFSAFIPMYLKTTYKTSPIFKKTKCLYTMYPEQLPATFQQDTFKKAKLREVKEEHLAPIGQGDLSGLMNLAATYADRTTRTFDHNDLYSQEWLDKFNIAHIPNNDNLATSYRRIYEELLQTT